MTRPIDTQYEEFFERCLREGHYKLASEIFERDRDNISPEIRKKYGNALHQHKWELDKDYQKEGLERYVCWCGKSKITGSREREGGQNETKT
jgi:hypothetical protein